MFCYSCHSKNDFEKYNYCLNCKASAIANDGSITYDVKIKNEYHATFVYKYKTVIYGIENKRFELNYSKFLKTEEDVMKYIVLL